MKIGRSILGMVIMVVIFMSVFTAKAYGGVVQQSHISQDYYRELEKKYVTQVRGILKDSGYENAGVTLTKVMDENFHREYTVTINHKWLATISYEEKIELEQQIRQVEFMNEECAFTHVFTKTF